MAQTEPRILFVPNLLKRRGYGHFRRCVQTARELGNLAALYIPPPVNAGNQYFEMASLLEAARGVHCRHQLRPADHFDLIVFDTQATSLELYEEIAPHGRLLLGWDEGGPARSRLPYVFDTLPNLKMDGPNLEAREFLDLGPAHPFKNQPISQVLVTFGGGDPHDLTHRVLHFLRRNHFFGSSGDPWEVTAVEGPLFTRPIRFPGINVLKSPASIQNILPGFDLVIASFGLTSLEALRAGVPVLLLNPTRYHEQLARKFDLPTFGIRRPKLWAFSEHLLSLRTTFRKAEARLPAKRASLADFLIHFEGLGPECPVCQSKGNRILGRTDHKTFFVCRQCTMVYMKPWNLPPTEYSEEYFFEAYEKQYGKTYLQDFPHIKAMGRDRLQRLTRLGAKPGQALLDVGCAYGPFLDAARDAGFQVCGADVSSGAVEHVKTVLGLPALLRGLEALSPADLPGGKPVHIVTLWYVIEHFPHLIPILTNLNRLVEKGGLLAFSTPNFRGVTGLFSPKKFFQDSPDDHFSLWDPRSARKVLERFGFKLEAVRITGHHPERFPGLTKTKGLKFALVDWACRQFGWGDTFEVYARKVKEI